LTIFSELTTDFAIETRTVDFSLLPISPFPMSFCRSSSLSSANTLGVYQL